MKPGASGTWNTSTIARIAGNLLSGRPPAALDIEDGRAVLRAEDADAVMWAVAMAYEIADEVQRLEGIAEAERQRRQARVMRPVADVMADAERLLAEVGR